MTDIIPPPELAAKWVAEIYDHPVVPLHSITLELVERAAQWGADQELEATLAEVSFLNSQALADRVRTARRPKPPSLKEQALQELDKVNMLWATEEFDQVSQKALDTIRCAIELIPDPS